MLAQMLQTGHWLKSMFISMPILSQFDRVMCSLLFRVAAPCMLHPLRYSVSYLLCLTCAFLLILSTKLTAVGPIIPTDAWSQVPRVGVAALPAGSVLPAH